MFGRSSLLMYPQPEDILDHNGDVVGPGLQPVLPGTASFTRKPAMYDGSWVCEVEIVRPEGGFIRVFQRKSKRVKELCISNHDVLVIVLRNNTRSSTRYGRYCLQGPSFK